MLAGEPRLARGELIATGRTASNLRRRLGGRLAFSPVGLGFGGEAIEQRGSGGKSGERGGFNTRPAESVAGEGEQRRGVQDKARLGIHAQRDAKAPAMQVGSRHRAAEPGRGGIEQGGCGRRFGVVPMVAAEFLTTVNGDECFGSGGDTLLPVVGDPQEGFTAHPHATRLGNPAGAVEFGQQGEAGGVVDLGKVRTGRLGQGDIAGGEQGEALGNRRSEENGAGFVAGAVFHDGRPDIRGGLDSGDAGLGADVKALGEVLRDAGHARQAPVPGDSIVAKGAVRRGESGGPAGDHAGLFPGGNAFLEARVVGGEELGTVIGGMRIDAAGGETAAHAASFVEDEHASAGGVEGGGGKQAGKAGANHKDIDGGGMGTHASRVRA